MDSSNIELNHSEIESIVFHNEILTIRFSKAYIIKTMTGSVERTRWWQIGELIFTNAKIDGALPTCPLVCISGDIIENIYTYRDMIPIPFTGRGHIRCILKFSNQTSLICNSAQTVQLQLDGVAKYIEHLRPPLNTKQ